MAIVESEIIDLEQKNFIDDLSRSVDSLMVSIKRLAALNEELSDRGGAVSWLASGTYGYEAASRIDDVSGVISAIVTALPTAARLKLDRVRSLRNAG